MTDDEKLMQQALEALEFEASGWEDPPPITREAITALRERLAQPAQPRQWQGLTDDEVMRMARDAGLDLEPTRNMLIAVRGQHAQLINLARAIEAKLKEKNT